MRESGGLDVGACIFYEIASMDIFKYHLKAHRISNNMVLKLPAQRQEGKSYDFKYCYNF